MYGLNSVYINNISRYFEIVQDFYNENTYLCISFFVNYTFLYFLYCSYVYYRKNFPKDIEDNLLYFTNLSEQLSTRNLYLDDMLNEVNVLSTNLTTENNKLLDTIKKQESDLNLLKKENSESKFLIDKLRQKLFITEKNVKELKSVVDNLDILLKNGDEQGASVYLSDFLSPNKKRKLG